MIISADECKTKRHHLLAEKRLPSEMLAGWSRLILDRETLRIRWTRYV